jgi:hypothetical protein
VPPERWRAERPDSTVTRPVGRLSARRRIVRAHIGRIRFAVSKVSPTDCGVVSGEPGCLDAHQLLGRIHRASA